VPLIESAIRLTHQKVFLDWSHGLGMFSGDVVRPTALAFALATLAATASWFVVEKPLVRGRNRPRIVEQAAP